MGIGLRAAALIDSVARAYDAAAKPSPSHLNLSRGDLLRLAACIASAISSSKLRRVGTRYDEALAYFLGFGLLAAVCLCLPTFLIVALWNSSLGGKETLYVRSEAQFLEPAKSVR